MFPLASLGGNGLEAGSQELEAGIPMFFGTGPGARSWEEMNPVNPVIPSGCTQGRLCQYIRSWKLAVGSWKIIRW